MHDHQNNEETFVFAREPACFALATSSRRANTAFRRLLHVALLVVSVLALHSSVANAQTAVVIVDAPSALLEATQRSLHPWQIEVSSISVGTIAPSESMPGARDRAHQLCEKHNARAIVWLTSNQDGEALWLYDRQSDRVVVRKVTVKRPMNDAGAAAVALSIKTLLMHTAAAPPEQRFGAVEIADAATSPTLNREAPWFVQSELGVRQGVTSGGRTDARLGLALFRRHHTFAFGLSLATGPGYAVDEERLSGHLTDWTAAVQGRYEHSWLGLYWVPSVHLGLHRTSLSGTLPAGGESIQESRVNPGIGGGLTLERQLGRTRIGLAGRARVLTRRQRYLVGGETVLNLPTSELELGFTLVLPL